MITSCQMSFDDVAVRFAERSQDSPPPGSLVPAAVAMLLRRNPAGMEMFFIERARRDDDPWSGNIGFPGGRVEPGDNDLRHTAERETMEEVAICLSGQRYIGRLSDIVGANLPVRVSCFVYGVAEGTEHVLSHEVNDALWVPLSELWSEERSVSTQVSFDGRSMTVPGIMLPHPGKPPLWGITYRLVTQFRELMEGAMPGEIPYELPL